MKIDTLGNPQNPAVILLHGMFCDASSVMRYAVHLQDEYFIIMPTMDGHYRASADYSGAGMQAGKLTALLHEMHVSEIAMFQGTSMGAEVALTAAKLCDIPVKYYFFDGGPFFCFPEWFREIMRKKFEGFARKFKGKSREDVMKDLFIRWIGGDNLHDYQNMLDSFVRSADFMTPESIRNITETCYHCILPEFPEAVQRKFIFHFSEKEPAQKSKKRLKQAYPYARYFTYPGNGHCGFQAAEPERYAAFLKKIISS